jgi:hypothetical protein
MIKKNIYELLSQLKLEVIKKLNSDLKSVQESLLKAQQCLEAHHLEMIQQKKLRDINPLFYASGFLSYNDRHAQKKSQYEFNLKYFQNKEKEIIQDLQQAYEFKKKYDLCLELDLKQQKKRHLQWLLRDTEDLLSKINIKKYFEKNKSIY